MNCPLCRRELRSAGQAYRCAKGHGFSAPELLAEQSTLASRLLRGVVGSLESTIALSADLASAAQEDGPPSLLRSVERELDDGKRTLAFVRARLLDDPDELDAYRI
ncbi:MAG TPA: hypothetical protein VNM14_23875 [Planctomycetota bacterium]|nr:hypothetical protein [Planctomycetota bacterium]